MFNRKELSYLKSLLAGSNRQLKQTLETTPEHSDARYNLENKLLMANGLAAKINRLAPSKRIKSQNETTRVLIIDDASTMRAINTAVLEEIGFSEIDTADCAITGLEMMKDAVKQNMPYTFVLSDVEMPKLSGIEFLKLARLDDNLWKTPIYLVTCLSDKNIIVDAISYGANGYFLKPIEQDVLQDKLAGYI